jgi:hypothetical protein
MKDRDREDDRERDRERDRDRERERDRDYDREHVANGDDRKGKPVDDVVLETTNGGIERDEPAPMHDDLDTAD